jgi:hypothetical protein
MGKKPKMMDKLWCITDEKKKNQWISSMNYHIKYLFLYLKFFCYQFLSNDIFLRKFVKRFKKFNNVKIGFGNVICGLSRYLNIKESNLFIYLLIS